MKMVEKELNEILLATATSDIAVRKELTKEILYKVSNLLATGTKLIPVRNYNVLDVKFTYPNEGVAAEYPVPEGANAGETAVAWSNFGITLEKAEARFTITDESILRGIATEQNRRSFMRAAESLAKKKDGNILSNLYAGAGQAQTVSNAWDTSNGTPADDVVSAWGLLLKNSNITDAEMKKVWLVLPAEAFAIVSKLQEISNINQRLRDWLEQSFGISLVATRSTELGGNAIMVVNSEETATHGVLASNSIPLSEEERIPGVGDRFTIRQYFNTKVVPESSSVATTKRIVKLDTVVT
jgi:hypothetical protein